MKRNGLEQQRLLLLIFVLLAASLQAGEIVPFVDDATARINITAPQTGAAGNIAAIETGGEITLAARFTAEPADLTAIGPVIIIEVGGTTYGNGLYLAGGNLIFATKGSNAAGGNDYTQTGLNDTDVSDRAAAVTIGPIEAGVQNEVYASYNANTGALVCSINNRIKIFSITGSKGNANLSGDESVSFLGSTTINAGQLGGLTSTSQGQGALWDANQAANLIGSGLGSIRGQIFASAISPDWLPNNPNPANGAIAIDPAVLTQLAFDAAEDPANVGSINPAVTGHFVNAYSDPNLSVSLLDEFVAAGDSSVSVSFNNFDLDETVYWTVEEQVSGKPKGDPNNIYGPLWIFKALPSIPAVTAAPANTSAFPDNPAIFICEFSSKSLATAKWFKVGQAEELSGPDIIISTDNLGTDYMSTLTINNVKIADEGAYYCQVANSSGPVDSDAANLGVKRLVAHWTLDLDDYQNGLYQDISGEGHHARPDVAPATSQFAPGFNALTAEALDLTIDPLAVADANDWEPTEMTGEMTLSIWCNWAGANGAYQGLITKRNQDDAGQNYEGWYYEVTASNTVNFGGPGVAGVSAPIDDAGAWAHWLVSVSPAATVLYKNGEPVASAGGTTISLSDATIKLGANNTKAGVSTPPFNGTIDDARIWNYALSPTEVAIVYTDIAGGKICVNRPAMDINGPDGEPDCLVDLYDLAHFAGQWLDCGFIPVPQCP